MKHVTNNIKNQNQVTVPRAGDIWIDSIGKQYLLVESFPHSSNGAEFWRVLTSGGTMISISTALIVYTLTTPARKQSKLIRLHD